MNFKINQSLNLLITFIVLSTNIRAHDPVFSPGPHTLFKDGIEIHTQFNIQQKDTQEINQASLALKYGLSGGWVVGISVPYTDNNDRLLSQSGSGDINLSTKYRFWREDSPGAQESAAIFANIKLDTARQPISTETTDSIIGMSYGYESLDWYRWASFRYRSNQSTSIANRGDTVFVDLATGYRFKINDYRKSDTVWMLELNGEYIEETKTNNTINLNSGGKQWFISPGLMWTLRNFAIKAGIQLPIYSRLKGFQEEIDYRAKLEFEWHI